MAMEIGRQLAELRQMTVRELRVKYQEVFGEPTRAGNKDFLFKRIAWRIQSLAEGDLSERARRRADVLARDAELRTTAPTAGSPKMNTTGSGGGGPAPRSGDERVPPPGTVLTRVYRGAAHHVTVQDNGFEYDGEAYRSLSAIAKKITGSHWNGLLFCKIAKPNRGAAARASKKNVVTAGSKRAAAPTADAVKSTRKRETTHG